MSRLLEVIEGALRNDQVVGLLDGLLLALGFGASAVSFLPALQRVRSGHQHEAPARWEDHR